MVCTKPLLTDKLGEVQDFKKITDYSRGIYGMYLNLIKEKLKDYTTCNRLDLGTLGSQMRASLHHGPWGHTMGYGLSSWSNFLKKNQFTKPLGPTLGVDQGVWPCIKKWMIFVIYVQKR